MGELGEERAAVFLRRRKGFKIVCRNWWCGEGEIDIVAWDGPVLVFVEVRSRRAGALVPGYHTLTRRKKNALRGACRAYLRQLRVKPRHFRLDIVEIRMRGPGDFSVNHYPNKPLFSKNSRF